MIDGRFVGWQVPVTSIVIERGQVALFCKAIGETNPVHLDEAAARADGLPGIIAPPTFGFSVTALAGQPFDYLAEMNVDIAKLLHGAQTFEHHAPLLVGGRITIATTIDSIGLRAGGRFEVIGTTSELSDADGALCVRLSSVFLVRNDQHIA